MADVTSVIKDGVLVGGCVLLAAGCGTAVASTQHAGKPTHKLAVTVTSKLPTPISGNGWSFAAYSQVAATKLVSADAALTAAKATGIDPGAWTNGSTPTATLVEFTNTFTDAPATPAWVIYATNVPVTPPVGPAIKPSTVPSHFTGIAEWIIDAQTGDYIAASDEGSPS